MSTLFQFQPEPDTPIVCDFTDATDTPQERFAEYGRLFNASLIGRERTADAVVLTFQPGDDVAEWVADLAAREAACCPFMSYHVTADETAIRWVTWGSEAMQPILDEYHAMYEAVKTSTPDELIDRVTAGGFEIRLPEPTRRRS
ncbi:MAG: hypothetical protein ACRDWF_00740 [Acidimicrobiia bacterium]